MNIISLEQTGTAVLPMGQGGRKFFFRSSVQSGIRAGWTGGKEKKAAREQLTFADLLLEEFRAQIVEPTFARAVSKPHEIGKVEFQADHLTELQTVEFLNEFWA